jgi:Zn-dependent alcohol dehydrogenase
VAKEFGATDFINPLQLAEGTRIQDHLVAITDGGLDFTFDCTGNVGSSLHYSGLRFLMGHVGKCDESST